jgi:hypothetical protein
MSCTRSCAIDAEDRKVEPTKRSFNPQVGDYYNTVKEKAQSDRYDTDCKAIAKNFP